VLTAGGLPRLESADGIEPDGVIAAMYREIVAELEGRHFEVNAFDYDWRLPAQMTAARLRAAVQDALGDPSREVHIVAHGVGGLVVIEALRDEAFLHTLAERQGRLITLGTPFGGSWDVERLLAGTHPLAKMLAHINGNGNDIAGVVRTLSTWPGFAEWKADAAVTVPPAALSLLTTIGGTGTPTAAATTEESGVARFLYDTDGDGRVLGADALVPGAAHAVVEATHFGLITRPEVLDTLCGHLVSLTAPVAIVPTAVRVPVRAREERLPDVVTSVELIDAASGAMARTMALVSTLQVSVVHGHLRQARYPLVVGHYRGDTIVKAEAALDAALGGRLRRRFDVGMYPGEGGTVEIIDAAGSHPPGGIVIGLGELGALTPQTLASLFAKAAVRFAVSAAETQAARGIVRPVAMSTLLIGADSGGSISIADSIRSIVRGVLDANRRLRAARLPHHVRIDHIEFVELYEEIAVKAAHVVGDLETALQNELTRSEEIAAKARLDAKPGGEFLRPAESSDASGWWRRVQVRAESKQGSLELVYTVLGDRAQLQQATSVQSLQQVSRLVTAAMTQIEVDLRLSNTLFELLVPPQLKSGVSQEGNVLLLLDQRAAYYPFELMAIRRAESARTRDDQGARGSGEPEETLAPLIESRGLLRQLQLDGITTGAPVTSNSSLEILVVGPPDVRGWRPLPGARAEADRVASLCTARGYEVTLLLDASSRDIQTRLFASNPRILHIAAHGFYNAADWLQSGVVIGDNEFLTTAHVRAMRTVPELVFLNCCHIGQVGPATGTPAPSLPEQGYPALAASLAAGFMSGGVRAVVAAGWAVDDDAGLTFARTLYERFLDGKTFGDAVKVARQQTRERHPKSSTWGAYQCYGSPEFRLRMRDSGAAAQPLRLVSRSELIAALRSLAGRAGGARGAELTMIKTEFAFVAKEVLEGRWSDGQTLAELGAVAAELEDFDEAITFYDRALEATRALAPITAVEQLANILARQAPRLAVTKGTDTAERAIELFKRALKWLRWLDTGLKPTAERLALLGSLHKRWAMLTTGRERRKNLRASCDAYGRARGQSGKQSYQILNWLALRYLLEPRRAYAELASLAQAEAEKADRQLSENPEPTFWDRTAHADALFHYRLFVGELAKPGPALEVRTAYERVLTAGPSARERASVRDHLQFLEEMLSDPAYERAAAPVSALKPLIALFA
jgi:tetratricopeptide (TPR) repeat protein